MHGTVVGVLRGGPSSRHQASLETGRSILESLSSDRYTARDIYIDQNGVWHERGVPVSPEKVCRSVDAIVLALHGQYGEDGEIQKVLERYGVPYTGSNAVSSYLATHKVFAKEHATEHGLETPRYVLVETEQELAPKAQEVILSFLQPVVVKPASFGTIEETVFTHGYAPLMEQAAAILRSGKSVLIEERIRGRIASVGIIDGLRGESLYALPPVEFIVEESRRVAPAKLPKLITASLVSAARTMHEALGLRHYSRSDFVVSPRGIYYLKTSTLPEFGAEHSFRHGMDSVGVSLGEFLEHLITRSLSR